MKPELLRAAALVDVLDAAGRTIANPHRAMVSLAGHLAMAIAVEKLWALALEADLLVRAVELPVTNIAERDAARDAAIALQAAEVKQLFSAITTQVPNPTAEETDDGTR